MKVEIKTTKQIKEMIEEEIRVKDKKIKLLTEK